MQRLQHLNKEIQLSRFSSPQQIGTPLYQSVAGMEKQNQATGPEQQQLQKTSNKQQHQNQQQQGKTSVPQLSKESLKTSLSNDHQLNMGEFISISTQLLLKSCEIIRDCATNINQIQKFDKGGNDPVTEADYKVQTMILNGYQKYFPKLKVIGEEEVEYKGKIDVDYEGLSLKNIPKANKPPIQIPTTAAQFSSLMVPYDEICVWIDPIDNTRGFIDNKLDAVTCLIGMSRNKKAYAGLIGAPFVKQPSTSKTANNSAKYSPTVPMGVVETSEAFRFIGSDQRWQPLTTTNLTKSQNRPRILTSRSRAGPLFEEFCSKINAEKMFCGGCGKKMLMNVNLETDMMVYLASFTSKWDTCAGEAIIKAMGGYVATPKGKELTYDPQDQDFVNKEGLFSTFDARLRDEMVKFFIEGKHEYEEYINVGKK